MGCSSSFPSRQEGKVSLPEVARAPDSSRLHELKKSNVIQDVKSNNASSDVIIPAVPEVEEIVMDRPITFPELTLQISDDLKEINVLVDNDQIVIEEDSANIEEDAPNRFSDESGNHFNKEDNMKQKRVEMFPISSISNIDIDRNMSLMTRGISCTLDDSNDIIPTSHQVTHNESNIDDRRIGISAEATVTKPATIIMPILEPLEIPTSTSLLETTSQPSIESQFYAKAIIPATLKESKESISIATSGVSRLSEPEPSPIEIPDLKEPVPAEGFQLRQPDCIGNIVHTDFSATDILNFPTDDSEDMINQLEKIIALEDKGPLIHSQILFNMSKKYGEYVETNIGGSEKLCTKIYADADTQRGAIDRLLLSSESLEILANQEKAEVDIWTEIDSVTAAEMVKDKISLVPAPPALNSRSPPWIKSKIKKDTISSDFASLDSYKISAKVGKIDLSFTTEAEIDVNNRIRRGENSTYFGSSLDSYRQSELVSRRLSSGKSPIATPRVRSGSGTPTIVEGIEENETEIGSTVMIPEAIIEKENEISHAAGQHKELVDKKSPIKKRHDGFLTMTSPDTPPSNSVKDIVGQIQRQSSVKTPITPSPLNLSPITPSSVSPVPLDRPRSVKDFVTKIQQNSRLPMVALPVKQIHLEKFSLLKHEDEVHKPKNSTIASSIQTEIELSQNIIDSQENLPLKNMTATYLLTTDVMPPSHENSSKVVNSSFNGDSALEVQTIIQGIEENETENGSEEMIPEAIMKNEDEISHIVGKHEKVVDKENIFKHSLDGFVTMTSPDIPSSTSVKDIVGQIQRPTSSKTTITTTPILNSFVATSSAPPALVDRSKSVKDIIGKWGVLNDHPERIKETIDIDSTSRRISDRWTPLRKDVIEKDVIKERPESSRVKGMVGTWGALATEASYKKRDSEIIVGKLSNRT